MIYDNEEFNISIADAQMSVKDKSSMFTPNRIYLYQNYPNPFNDSTVILFKLSKPNYVKLSVYNLLGREIEILVNQFLDSGEYKVKWQANERASGLYICRLQIDNQQETRKMLLMR